MNGDTGKISASAVYTSSTDSSLTGLASAAIDTQTGTTILSSNNNNNNNNNNLNNNNASLAIMSQSQFGPRVANNCVQVPTTNEYSNVNGLMANATSGNTSSSTASSYDGAASIQSTDLYQSDISQNVDSSTSVTTAEGAVMPLDQLKQMLLTQLEYYFSRYAHNIVPLFIYNYI